MAYSKASNDRTAVRHDYGSLFGGSSIRNFDSDTQVFNFDSLTGSLVFTDIGSTYRVVYKASKSTGYTGPLDNGISVRSGFEEEVLSVGNSSSNDYMLDWGRARFNSISLEFKDSNNNWIIAYQYAMTGGLGHALPNRGTTDESILADIKNSISTSNSATYGANFFNSWEYQCALYNWQYPEGSSTVQYLFGDDNLNGTRLRDVITGGAGSDTINGGVGNDVLYGSFGADILYGAEGDDVIYFDGGSSVWNYKGGSNTSRGSYYTHTIDQASGGTGNDYFVFELPSFNLTASDPIYPSLPDLYGNLTGTLTNYNPFLSQSHNSTPFSTSTSAYAVSPLTFRTRILDFKVGADKLDLSNFGIDLDFINLKSLAKLSGADFIKAANLVLKTDGYSLAIGKSAHTANNTTLFIREAGVDTNDNLKLNDTLLEIQLVGLTATSIGIKIFGDS
jgi:Ca2+-binding RTX toxin-like protein